MPQILREFLQIAAIVVLTLSVIALAFVGLNKATGFTDKMFGKMDGMTTTMDESDYEKYNGTVVTGSEVIAAVKYFANSDPICVTVASKSTVSYLYTDTSLTTKSTENIASASQKGNPNYINPNGKFLGEVVRDTTDNSIVGLNFTIQATP